MIAKIRILIVEKPSGQNRAIGYSASNGFVQVCARCLGSQLQHVSVKTFSTMCRSEVKDTMICQSISK